MPSILGVSEPMIKRFVQNLLRFVLLGLLLLGVSACSLTSAQIPSSVLSEAVQQQAIATQQELWRHLNLDPDSFPTVTVRRVHINRVRQVKVADEIAYEVNGTYRSRVRYRDRRPIQESPATFALVLKAPNQTDVIGTGWELLQREEKAESNQYWHWEVLSPA